LQTTKKAKRFSIRILIEGVERTVKLWIRFSGRGLVFCAGSPSAYLVCLLHVVVWRWITADQAWGLGERIRKGTLRLSPRT
jgi:hypothetical protein